MHPRNYGQAGLKDHDQCYALADEFCDVCYKLPGTSWDEDAVVKDRVGGIYVHPSKVHDIHHDNKYYQVRACHFVEPSLRRTRVLFQAGSSPSGREFAARHAECVFMIGSKPEIDGPYISDIRKNARQQGRDPEEILCFAYRKVITGDIEAAAKQKYDEYFEQCSCDGGPVLQSGWTGIDVGEYKPDQPLEYIQTNAIRTILHNFTGGDPN